MKKKLLTAILAPAACLCLGLAACDTETTLQGGTTEPEQDHLERDECVRGV